MRHYDIPYVQNPPRYTTTKSMEDLTLQELTKTYLCGKSQGKISECMKCPAPCEYGKRALDLAIPKPQTNSSPKLFNGKTMIEKAKEDNAKRRAKEQEEIKPQPDKTEKKKKNNRIVIENWYDQAYQSGEPLKWIMDHFECNERKAKQKVYSYQHDHPELKTEKPMWEPARTGRKQKVTETSVKREPAKTSSVVQDRDTLLAPLEDKINHLMNQQDEYKKKIEHYQKLYQETKTKVDALYEALNILNE